jgi:hypothetical protein
MQLTKFPSEVQLPRILDALEEARIRRYLPAAKGSAGDAFKLYQWNCLLCEAFHVPLHFVEIACRNAIHNRLLERHGEDWFDNLAFLNLLDDKHHNDLQSELERERKQHGASMTPHHIVSSLSFGFWQHLLTRRFQRFLDYGDMRDTFPNVPRSVDRDGVYSKVQKVRQWRNRIAHHRAIFDKGPMRHFQDIQLLTRWVSHDLADWVTDVAQVSAAIDLRPVPAA